MGNSMWIHNPKLWIEINSYRTSGVLRVPMSALPVAVIVFCREGNMAAL